MADPATQAQALRQTIDNRNTQQTQMGQPRSQRKTNRTICRRPPPEYSQYTQHTTRGKQMKRLTNSMHITTTSTTCPNRAPRTRERHSTQRSATWRHNLAPKTRTRECGHHNTAASSGWRHNRTPMTVTWSHNIAQPTRTGQYVTQISRWQQANCGHHNTTPRTRCHHNILHTTVPRRHNMAQ